MLLLLELPLKDDDDDVEVNSSITAAVNTMRATAAFRLDGRSCSLSGLQKLLIVPFFIQLIIAPARDR